jgi:uncharacterized Zn-finger protein
MAQAQITKLVNNAGVAEIKIGVKEFECMGASEPYDHPHVYLDMGKETEIICPYCSTLYRYDSGLKSHETKPKNMINPT